MKHTDRIRIEREAAERKHEHQIARMQRDAFERDLQMGRIEFGPETKPEERQNLLSGNTDKLTYEAIAAYGTIMSTFCYDCHLPYGDEAWIEAVVSHDIWKQIAPVDGEGILCINCMAKRCAKLGLENVPVMLTAGPFVTT